MDSDIPLPENYGGDQPPQRSGLRTCLIVLGVMTAISCIGMLIVGIMFGAAVNQLIAQIQSGDLSGMEGVTITTGEDDGFFSEDDDFFSEASDEAETTDAAEAAPSLDPPPAADPTPVAPL
ncbi:MAG: hypothetical protein HC911_07295, partial [Chloroflexaceae bacterium]|nr:hypothetical protein [Chloroflexaceae bacterium]